MKNRLNAFKNKIWLLFGLFFVLGSSFSVSKAVNYEDVSRVEAAKSGGQIILKYNNEDHLLTGYVGEKISVTTQSLGLPYFYCIERGVGIYWSNYKVQAIKKEENNQQAYILASTSDREYKPNDKKYWHKNKEDRVQIATWKSKLNEGDHTDIDNWLFTKLLDEPYNYTATKIRQIINAGNWLLSEANDFEAYRNNYKPAKRNTTTPKLLDNNIIGPFNITFTRGASKTTGRVFGGWMDETTHEKLGTTPFTLTAVMADGTTKELKNDGTDWDFVDKYGKDGPNSGLTQVFKGVWRPTSGKDFYIEIRNPDVVKVVDLKLNFFSTEAYAKWYRLENIYGSNSERPAQQNFGVVDLGYIRKIKESINIPINMDLNIKLAGRVFLDGSKGKELNPNGIKDAADTMLSGITVNLRKNSDKSVVATTTTNKDGYYEFKVKPDTYYVEFIYDGQNYEPTTYNMQKKEIADGVWNKTGIPERSYATDGKENRQRFNAEYAEITGNVARERKISAFTGRNGEQERETYGLSSSKDARENINLGLMEREKANIVLSKDLWEVKVTINGYTETYIYNSRDGEDMKIVLRGTDVNQYQRAVRRTDISYISDIKVTYRIRLYNASEPGIKTEVTELVDWYTPSYKLERLYTAEQKEIAYTKEQENDKFTKIRTNGYSSGAFDSGTSQYLYADYTINQNNIKDLFTNENTLENYAEIAAYKTYYKEKRMDLNNDLVMHEGYNDIVNREDYKENDEIKAIAGLVDSNSVPNNFDPSQWLVDYFVHDVSKRPEFKQLSTDKKVILSNRVFQDDADMAPGLKLVISADERTIVGNVWEDITELKENVRKGNGTFDQGNESVEGEPTITEVKVELIDVNTGEVAKDSQGKEILARTKKDGSYELRGFIPGEYYIRFTYGDEEALKEHEAKYNGQDYKSTLYDISRYETKENELNPYWYAKEMDKRYSDASDDMDKRAEVNNNTKEMTNYKATLLAKKEDKEKLAEKTHMTAKTANMTMEVEYASKITPYNPDEQLPSYALKDIDFGLAERPRSQLTIEKKVSNVKMITHDGQDILAVTDKQGPNLAWVESDQLKNEKRTKGHIQATVDNALINGASIFIDYNITVKNTSEDNYVLEVDGATKEDDKFYHRGEASDNAKLSKVKADYIVDYINNNLVFDKEENKEWETITNPNELFNEDKEATMVQKDLEGVITQYQTIIKATSENPLLTSLEPNETREVKLHLKQVGMATDTKDTLQYDNGIEIVRLTEQAGRRQEYSVVGNFNPTENYDIANLEPDTSIAETVTVLPPFGNSNIIYLVSAIAIVSVLGIGIFFIIKKILPKKE